MNENHVMENGMWWFARIQTMLERREMKKNQKAKPHSQRDAQLAMSRRMAAARGAGTPM